AKDSVPSEIYTYKITNEGRTVLGTNTETKSNTTTEIIGAQGISLLLGDITADSVEKRSRLGVLHYEIAEEPMGIFFTQATSSGNSIFLGGGTSLFNAATGITFYTASNNKTLTGTGRWSIRSTGDLELLSGGGNLTTAKTSVDVFNTTATSINAFGAATSLTLGATSGSMTIRNPIVNIPAVTSTALSDFQANSGIASVGVGGSIDVTISGLTTGGIAIVSYKTSSPVAPDTVASWGIPSSNTLRIYGKVGWVVGYFVGKK
ncbi:MAG: hypothetical protein L0287_37855, partial [Anaerolineae bacterium]|nr:hypothetical protein [Anaerolineae bacterium]